ncbi:MAG: hypothetical protein FWC67_02965 [Defluviitaleaceae bacterium]|nr:hypothetical protein [Defluviitaleaceae bacterium]
MSIFRRNGFFNRNQQQHHQQRPFNPYFQNNMNSAPMPNMQNFHHGHANFRGQMPQMGQMPQQQMPPHMHQRPPMQQQRQQQAPYHDPSVRFEPIPDGMLPGQPQIPPQPAPQQQHPQTPQPQHHLAVAEKFKEFVQGEANGLIFYESLAKAEEFEGQMESFVGIRAEGARQLTSIYKQATMADFAPEQAKTPDVDNFRAGLSFALMQESKQLRELSAIQSNIKDERLAKQVSTVLHNKIADIAHLMSL